MSNSNNKKVQQFLNELILADAEKHRSLQEMRQIVFDTYPETEERMMYGGIMFSLNGEDYSGLFVRKKHISFEFSIGYQMEDPEKVLEGKGQFRRHLKIRKKEDIVSKRVAFFVQQAK